MICIFNAAQIPAETVLVQLFMGHAVPEAAGVRGNFICQHQGTVSRLAKLQLEVNQLDIQLLQVIGQQFVNPQAVFGNLLQVRLADAKPMAAMW